MVQQSLRLVVGMVTVGPVYAQRRDGSLLPQNQSGQVTAVGCLVQGDAVRGGKKGKYVLARVRKGPAANVPENSCTAEAGADALMVDNPEKAKITDAMVGHWVEISGRLESETSKDPDNLRELDVRSGQGDPGRRAAHPGTGPDARRATGASRRRTATDNGPRAGGRTRADRGGSEEAAEDGEPPAGDRIGGVALVCRQPRAAVVPAPAPRVSTATDRDGGQDRCAGESSLTTLVGRSVESDGAPWESP